jgi:predicted MFS family arabinose efflux permease
VAIVSNIILALAVALIPLLSWGPWLLVAFSVASLGAAFRQGPLTALISELVPSTQRGAFIALRNIFSQTGIGIAAFLGGLLYERHGYGAVTTLCAVMTGVVVLLLITHIVEPQPIQERV